MQQRIVALDAMGGDNAPEAIVEGSVQALRKRQDLTVLLCGPEEKLRSLIAEAGDVKDRLLIEPASETITMDESPMLAVRRKKDSSLVRAMMAVKEGRAEACVSAGSTGAVLAGGIMLIGRIRGIDRPALNVLIPGRKKPFLLLDCGANVDCQSKYLLQFALMGSVYMEKVLGVKSPDVRLANIGLEAEKGNRLAKETWQLMHSQNVFRFGGNIEARDIPEGACDVVVCDGFDGNLLLKYTEGMASSLAGVLKDEMLSSTRGKIGALLLKPALKRFKARLNADEVGGSPLLGIRGTVVKAHGNARAMTIDNAISLALRTVDGQVPARIEEGMAQILKDQQQE